MTDITLEQLTGRDDGHLDRQSFPMAIHYQVVDSLRLLLRDAQLAGFDLAIASSYRNFDRQALIWNAKARGERPVLDDQEQALDISGLDSWQLAQAILRWSALPGASRHHWGTDLDIYDRNAVAEGYQVQLTQAEFSQGGPFEALHHWLNERISAGEAHGFFRPYQRDFAGVAPEPWHLSYAPLSKTFQQRLTLDLLKPLWRELVLGDTIIAHADTIYDTYVAVPWSEYPE
jgi:LAS superfamily LD-carboxypeptidase LdcB